MPTVISNITLLLAVRHIGGTLTSILGAMEPVTAVVIGACVFGESFTTTEAAGIALILIAVVLIILTNRIKEGVETVMKRIRPRHV
jgi:drug/metabolite transporter (DMT)-like permease